MDELGKKQIGNIYRFREIRTSNIRWINRRDINPEESLLTCKYLKKAII